MYGLRILRLLELGSGRACEIRLRPWALAQFAKIVPSCLQNTRWVQTEAEICCPTEIKSIQAALDAVSRTIRLGDFSLSLIWSRRNWNTCRNLNRSALFQPRKRKVYRHLCFSCFWIQLLCAGDFVSLSGFIVLFNNSDAQVLLAALSIKGE